MAEQIVAPGEEIKPEIDLVGAVRLAERLYGIRVAEARELDGYDDKNYHFKVTDPPENHFIKQLWPHGYVFKIMNSSDSKKLDCVEAQCKMMIHLDEHGIMTPQPQRTIDGRLFSLEKLYEEKDMNGEKSREHVVRLLSFQDGTLMKDISWSYKLNYEAGRFTATIDLTLKDFFHPAYKQYSSLWMLKNVSNIKQYLFVLKDEDERVNLVMDVVQKFENDVLSRFSLLKLGMIHGDIHDQNLLCQQDNHGEWHISAVLDLGDSHYSAYVIELALAIAYLTLQSNQIRTGAHVIAGYCSHHPLPLEELKLLKVCVCARLCQSLVLGLYNYSLYPNNEYVLTTQSKGWDLLKTIWATDSTLLEEQWFSQLPNEYKLS